jgi:preprotein translocase subunit SecG
MILVFIAVAFGLWWLVRDGRKNGAAHLESMSSEQKASHVTVDNVADVKTIALVLLFCLVVVILGIVTHTL